MATEFIDVTRGDTSRVPEGEEATFQTVTKKRPSAAEIIDDTGPDVIRDPSASEKQLALSTQDAPAGLLGDTFEDTGVSQTAIQQRKGAATGLSFGLGIGGAETGETEFASADTLVKILGGAGVGFVTGGPAGAIAGGLAAGLGAFLATRGSKRRKKEVAAKEARYRKAVEQQIAREDRINRQQRFDKLEQTGFDRKAEKMKQQWDAYKDFNSQIMGVINNNASLKQRFAKSGF